MLWIHFISNGWLIQCHCLVVVCTWYQTWLLRHEGHFGIAEYSKICEFLKIKIIFKNFSLHSTTWSLEANPFSFLWDSWMDDCSVLQSTHLTASPPHRSGAGPFFLKTAMRVTSQEYLHYFLDKADLHHPAYYILHLSIGKDFWKTGIFLRSLLLHFGGIKNWKHFLMQPQIVPRNYGYAGLLRKWFFPKNFWR